MSGYLLFLIVLVAYILLIALVWHFKKDALKKRGITLWGPFIMVRTQRGKRFLERLARRKRFWETFGNFSIGLVVFFMIAMFLLLLWEATIIGQIPKESAPTPQMLVGVPGINPLIPIWYGIWGLVVGILVHESCHGILTFVGKMKVKSMGVLFFIIPMGAFVEPDEEQLKETDRKKRMRVYAVGPGINIIFAMACGAIFSLAFMGAIVPASEGAPVTYVMDGTPADGIGLEKGDFIVSMNGTDFQSGSSFFEFMNTTSAGDAMEVELFHKGQGARDVTVVLGYWGSFDSTYKEQAWYAGENASIGITVEEDNGALVVERVMDDSPAEKAGLTEGDVLASIANCSITTMDGYNQTMNGLVPGQEVPFGTVRDGEPVEGMVTPGAGKGYMGIYVTKTDLGKLAAYLNRPGKGIESSRDLFTHTIGFIGLPFQTIGPEDKLTPMEGLITELYVVEGPMSALPEGAFWITANLLYWAFWISLMVGLTNALPAVPMDGGYVFHDLVTGFASRFSDDHKKVEKNVDRLAITIALSVLVLILWQLIGPRI